MKSLINTPKEPLPSQTLLWLWTLHPALIMAVSAEKFPCRDLQNIHLKDSPCRQHASPKCLGALQSHGELRSSLHTSPASPECPLSTTVGMCTFNFAHFCEDLSSPPPLFREFLSPQDQAQPPPSLAPPSPFYCCLHCCLLSNFKDRSMSYD